MPDELDPPRKHYGFKEREFKRDNVITPGAAPLPTTKDLAIAAGTRPNPAARPAAPKADLSAVGPAKADDPNDVYAVLQANRRAAQQHGLGEIEIKAVKSRRKREFWLLIVGGNVAILGGVFLSGINVITVVFGLAGLIIFSLGLSWVMWQVMDKY
ncbi:hypothetical protein Verru16b_01637 [Lacunisphaera limnophila]|uniref:Uncharacterized protein n=1 Tax=Lacunisphaera limnophila TaxID=1838286 RepID=A0A1D8AUL5_9BACT|nr:hypothetical protein [Lacunisphaera limnophila]AOS44574.1 hypothetical protein Verru16b_01637 [Lacunisphaera limnophila]